MADTLARIRSDLEKRLKELEPLVQEHAHVRQALDALKSAGSRVHRPSSNGASRPVVAKPAAAVRRGRPRGSGARAQEALKLVEKHPGITMGELAKKMKIKANYLYRVLPQLEKAGKVRRHEKGYHKADD
jgi:predicted Rossmann fold nucleotide-binding protein DprA/Smf involved in DNA uptake